MEISQWVEYYRLKGEAEQGVGHRANTLTDAEPLKMAPTRENMRAIFGRKVKRR